MKSFNLVWAELQDQLKPKTKIKNWTAFNGYMGDSMIVTKVGINGVVIDTPKAINLQQVPRHDFEVVWSLWSAYKSQKVKRHELRDTTRFSKYIISILHWYESQSWFSKLLNTLIYKLPSLLH